MTIPYFPFSAIVEQEKLKEALLLNAINPAIGGVLIFGEKGTAKSTAVRGLKRVLELSANKNPVPLVELPLSATEEMVVGTINIPDTLKTEEIQIEYGLLHKAHNGIIYIDEVNLLEDHLVNSILDAAAMGVNRIEREGVSHEHPSNFILVGTMNPEEGELRPQLLDRFGISVKVKTETDLQVRKDIVTRRLDWEKDKAGFTRNWLERDEKISLQIKTAQYLLPQVTITEELLELSINIALSARAEGHRADLVIVNTAKTLASLAGRQEVNHEDVHRAAEYALNHRSDSPPIPPSNNKSQQDKSSTEQNNLATEEQSKSNNLFQSEQDPAPQNHQTIDMIVKSPEKSLSGANIFKKQKNPRGVVTGSKDKMEGAIQSSDIAIFPTLINGIRKGKKKLSLIGSGDLRFKRRKSGLKALHLIVIDTSASMGTHNRLAYAKGLLKRILLNGYQKKNYVAVVGTEGRDSKVFLQPSRNIVKVDRVMDSIKAKGKTPLLHAIQSALNLVDAFKRQNKFIINLMVIISDGRINVPIKDSIPKDLDEIGKRIRQLRLPNIIVDSNHRFTKSILLQKMGVVFGGIYMSMEEVNAQEKISL